MLEIFDVSYDVLSDKKSEEFFTLRKEVFKDRLNWAVNCIDGMEFDEYDNHNANYLFGVMGDSIVCGSRIIEMKFPNMITGTFYPYFEKITLPEGNYIESSRFFVDKDRAKKINHKKYPISSIFLLATLNYAKEFNYDGILTIVSHAMLAILRKSGWNLSIIAQGLSEKNEKVYLLNLPTDAENQDILINHVTEKKAFENKRLKEWPLVCSLS